MNDVEEKLKKINSDLDRADISLSDSIDFNREVFSLFSNRNLSFKTFQLIGLNLEKGIGVFFCLVKKWQERKIKVSEEELKKIEEFDNNVLKVFLKRTKESLAKNQKINKKDKERFEKNLVSLAKKEQELSVFIEKEKNRSLTQSEPTNSSPSNLDSSEKEKIHDLQVNSELTASANDYEKSGEVIQKIDSLRVELKNIEQNLIDLHPQDQENIKAIERLRNEFIKLQEQIQEELKQIKISKQKDSIPSKPRDEFNWLYVVIPLGILTIIAGIIITYLLGKKSKKE